MMKNTKQHRKRGAALILVVVVTVLLAVIGTMFLMTSRVSEMETVAVTDERDLKAAVETVVGRIDEVLVEDLFGIDPSIINANAANFDADEPYDYPAHNLDEDAGPDGIPGNGDDVPFIAGPDGVYWTSDDIPLPGNLDDCWLASLEPVWSDDNGTPADPYDDIYVWPHITDLWGTLQVEVDSLFTQSYQNPSVRWIDPHNINDQTTWDQPAEWDLWQVSADNVEARVIAYADRMDTIAIVGGTAPASWDAAVNQMPFGARADADGDGVADSRWVRIPNLTTSRGRDVFAAVRIIDNCAMLNLNAAHCFYQDSYAAASATSPYVNPWNYFNQTGPTTWIPMPYYNPVSGIGRYLTEINYLPFLRGHDLNGGFWGGTTGDNWLNIMIARNMAFTGTITGFGNNYIPISPEESQNIFFNFDNPNYSGSFFDISDELEIRNRYLVTSYVESRFEQPAVANFTLDSANGGGGAYAALEVPRDATNDFGSWTRRIDPINFDQWDASGAIPVFPMPDPYEYDRRHVCTFYSLDRNFRQGDYPLLDSEIGTYANANWAAARYASAAAYRAYLWERWGAVFTPIGPVTTNIENPDAARTFDNVETRRRILHLLYALREYYLPANYFSLPAAQQATERNAAALRAAQIVANLIDFSDDSSANTSTAGTPYPVGETYGPFYGQPYTLPGPFLIDYGQQANANCTFITRQVVNQLLFEVSQYELGVGNTALDFGLNATDIVFGYERQPFISEVYTNWNTANAVGAELDTFAIELVNPYDTPIDLLGWTLRIGAFTHTFIASPGNTTTVPAYSPTTGLGRLVINFNNSAAVPGGAFSYNISGVNLPILQMRITGARANIDLLRPAPAIPAAWGFTVPDLYADHVANADILRVVAVTFPGLNSLKRSDTNWEFIYDQYEAQNSLGGPFTSTLGQPNGTVTLPFPIPAAQQFQLAVPNDQFPVCRWHDLEVLSLFGNGSSTAVPARIITNSISTTAAGRRFYDLAGATNNPLEYLCTMNRPDVGTLPGRININTAPVHVIAAAIPPMLVAPSVSDPNGTVTDSALDYAQAIVDRRNTVGPFERLSDLLNITGVPGLTPDFRLYANDPNDYYNAGQQSIENDIEERDWILSNLANKFTVRSDVFTAYILVRLGENGPQRRMIAIFDRSGVWTPEDRPRLVALHPVPDPR